MELITSKINGSNQINRTINSSHEIYLVRDSKYPIDITLEINDFENCKIETITVNQEIRFFNENNNIIGYIKNISQNGTFLFMNIPLCFALNKTQIILPIGTKITFINS